MCGGGKWLLVCGVWDGINGYGGWWGGKWLWGMGGVINVWM